MFLIYKFFFGNSYLERANITKKFNVENSKNAEMWKICKILKIV